MKYKNLLTTTLATAALGSLGLAVAPANAAVLSGTLVISGQAAFTNAGVIQPGSFDLSLTDTASTINSSTGSFAGVAGQAPDGFTPIPLTFGTNLTSVNVSPFVFNRSTYTNGSSMSFLSLPNIAGNNTDIFIDSAQIFVRSFLTTDGSSFDTTVNAPQSGTAVGNFSGYFLNGSDQSPYQGTLVSTVTSSGTQTYTLTLVSSIPEVPEPGTIVGLAIVATGAAATLKKKQSRQA